MYDEATRSEASCREIAGEVKDSMGWIAQGLRPEQILQFVLDFESRKLARHGLSLIGAISPAGHAVFSLRHVGSGELCASMDVDPRTCVVVAQHTCGWPHDEPELG